MSKYHIYEKTRYLQRVCFPYLGREYELDIRRYLSYKKPGVKPEGNRLVVLTASIEEQVIEAALKQWYSQQAGRIIRERVEYYQKILQEPISCIRIKDVKSRWGSCSSKRNLNFNWRLVMAPPEVLDYVVVHELCHLKEMNHSKAFWALVESILPDYKRQREWLKECRLIEKY